jgi:hypothetical protein
MENKPCYYVLNRGTQQEILIGLMLRDQIYTSMTKSTRTASRQDPNEMVDLRSSAQPCNCTKQETHVHKITRDKMGSSYYLIWYHSLSGEFNHAPDSIPL